MLRLRACALFLLSFTLLFCLSCQAAAKELSYDWPFSASPQQVIDSLQTQHAADLPDSIAYEHHLILAKAHYFNAFQENRPDETKQADLQAAHAAIQNAMAYHKTPTARAFECLIMLEENHFLSLKDASLNFDMCKKELEDILRTDAMDFIANIAYGQLAYEVRQIQGFRRFLAKIFYTPLADDVNYETALLYFLQAKYLQPSPVVFYQLARAYFALGNHRDALLSIKTCVATTPERPYIDLYYQHLAEQAQNTYNTNH
ncbi:hypothetical protein Ctha_0625 [Chloroherpeton thalassium ATCC 35110]|uniref:Tetratricopeptide repeat protein n=1 Tax=Chloroherpeton thalassium (strain ATCC 35110 / GB-78) TaxID=517418 RepID=B3QVN8_CHLT3|nr:hypothetical protein [Chloroherpeton thalassium]ACF13095.1 hypothetical protein Ctha_0625 [Chloroherpeton thalassium ATCC 35110]